MVRFCIVLLLLAMPREVDARRRKRSSSRSNQRVSRKRNAQRSAPSLGNEMKSHFGGNPASACMGLEFFPMFPGKSLVCKYVRAIKMIVPEAYVLPVLITTLVIFATGCFAWRRRRFRPAAYALWLVPTDRSLTVAVDMHPVLAKLTADFARSRAWGGQLHVPLSAFSERKGAYVAIAKRIASGSASSSSAGSAKAWTGGGWKRADATLATASYAIGKSATFRKLVKRLGALEVTGALDASNLRLTFHAARERTSKDAWPLAVLGLAALEWSIAVVRDVDPGDEKHRAIEIKPHQRFKLMR